MMRNSSIREAARDRAPQPAASTTGSAEPAVSRRAHRRGVLDDFLARSALLVIIYAVINVVYQQAYLNYLGFRVGLWPVATALPLLTDFLVAFYAFMIWVLLTRFPDRWFNTVAELFNLGTWQDRDTWLFRGASLLFPYLVFYIVNTYDLPRRSPVPPSHRERLFPTQGFFSQTIALVVFVVLCLVFAAGVGYYRYLRRQGIRQVTPVRRVHLRVLLNGILPGGLMVLMATAFLILPSWYGRQRAHLDVRRLVREDLQVVSNMTLAGPPVCNAPEPLPGPPGTGMAQEPEWRVHFLGHLQDLYLLLIVQVLPTDSSPRFYTCLVSASNLHGVQLGGPDTY